MKYAVIRDDTIVRFYHAKRDLAPPEIKRDGGKAVLRPVRIEGFDRSFDPEIFERRGPRFTVTATEVVEEYWLAFRADARKTMLDKIDARAEKERARVVVDLLDAADTVVATVLDTGREAFQTFGVWNLRAVADAAVPAGTR
jgi:hypothetical protein